LAHRLTLTRLLSAPGIPKLRAFARSGKISKKLRLKGKGHEFSDVARLLNYYQLWLDDLYPRAKFADGLQLVEKVGHSKHMQVMRKEWIDEGKPGYARDRRPKKVDDQESDDMYSGDNPATKDMAMEDDSLFIPDSRKKADTGDDDHQLPEDDELDALLAEQDAAIVAPPRAPLFAQRTAPMEVDSEGEDDLDALLAESETRRAPASKPASTSNNKTSSFDEDAEMDDLDALLAEQEARPGPPMVQSKVDEEPRSPFADDEDELDALLAEQEAALRPRSSNAVDPTPGTTQIHDTPNQDEPADANAAGEDMFSSSPVRTNAAPRNTMEDGTATAAPDFLHVGGEESLGASGTPAAQQSPSGEIEDRKSPEAEAEAEEEEPIEADDMFSSSPLQN
jgi:replication fork protection complex subunit Csm3/Swi3